MTERCDDHYHADGRRCTLVKHHEGPPNYDFTFHITYYYLATGMEGHADIHDYGEVTAKNQLEAKRKVAERECKNPQDRLFFMGCLSARIVR